MATPERHDCILDVADDILTILAENPEIISEDMRKKLEEYNITNTDITNASVVVRDIRDLFKDQMF